MHPEHRHCQWPLGSDVNTWNRCVKASGAAAVTDKLKLRAYAQLQLLSSSLQRGNPKDKGYTQTTNVSIDHVLCDPEVVFW
jgi:hypothetical protein